MDSEHDEDWQCIHAYLTHGDQAAFRRVYERHAGGLTRFAAGILGREELAREVVAEAFARVVDRKPAAGKSFRAFAFTVVRRLALDRLRRTATARRLAPAPPSVDRASPEEGAVVREQTLAVRRAVESLKPKHREVLLLYYGQDLTSTEVAEVLGCTDQQVRSRLAYARTLVRQQLEE